MGKIENVEVLELNEDFEDLERELGQLPEIEKLRTDINEGLERELQELQDLSAKLPKAQAESLFDQCTQNALNAVVGHFGLASAVLGAKDGGNVDTAHNAREGIYASEKERQRYENRGEYNPDEYHKDKEYKRINKEQSELKAKGELNDYMTGKKLILMIKQT